MSFGRISSISTARVIFPDEAVVGPATVDILDHTYPRRMARLDGACSATCQLRHAQHRHVESW